MRAGFVEYLLFYNNQISNVVQQSMLNSIRFYNNQLCVFLFIEISCSYYKKYLPLLFFYGLFFMLCLRYEKVPFNRILKYFKTEMNITIILLPTQHSICYFIFYINITGYCYSKYYNDSLIQVLARDNLSEVVYVYFRYFSNIWI